MERIENFNLAKAGDNAIVRLLHKSISTIESADSHWVTQKDGSKRCVKCIGENCPLCKVDENTGSPRYRKDHKVYIHLYDYTDNKEKVWVRTDKILPSFESLEKDWGDLSALVLKITRDTDDFPKYSVQIMPPQNYKQVSNETNTDIKLAYMNYMTRSLEELNEFVKTGVIPPHKKKEMIPKEQWIAQQKAKQNNVLENAVESKVESVDVGEVDDSGLSDALNYLPF